jgi:hypothetical protein
MLLLLAANRNFVVLLQSVVCAAFSLSVRCVWCCFI